MIERYYKRINILEFQAGSFETPAEYVVSGSFMGLIQAPSNNAVFNNSKDTSSVAGTLFCSNKQHFEPKTIIEYNGTKYLIAGQGTQTDGVTGIQPKRGQHAQYRLEWLQEGI
ncbi:MAG: hypothetical protein II306_06505 [Clostridia bacterium]|nr:hypothetical protein [Clostridia bacterium]